MKTRYYLKKKSGQSTHPIYIALYEGDETELIFTGHRLQLKQWSTSERRPIDQTGEVSRSLERMNALISKARLRLEADDQPITPFTVKQAFESLSQAKDYAQLSKDKKAKEGLRTIYQLAKEYKENLPDKFSKATRTTVKISIDQFMQYLDKIGRRSLEVKDLSEIVINDYAKYLLEKRRLANSTHNKRMKHLNWFLRSIHFHIKLEPRKLKKRAIIALTIPELRALESVDVTTHKDKASHEYFKRAKDMFLLGCYTALRISDLKRINPTNSAGGFISLITQKNNEVFRMPILKQAQRILDKYEGRAPRISEQEVNRSIKDVCELAGIKSDIEIEGTKAGKSFSKILPKFKLISSHIAGKTFITNAKELWGLDPAEVAGIVRKDLKTMLNHYFKPPVESATLKMINADKAQMKVA